MNNNKIDFVVTWVDGNDPEWQKEKNKAKGLSEGDARDSRYREWGTLKYWFRGIERFAPWVNQVFFVTCGHYPDWLNLEHPKLRFVKHSDFIPKQYLPTFSCRPIEFNLHRIPELSECFVYFNDDMFLIDKVEPTDFFVKGLPCDSAILDCQSPMGKGNSGEKLELAEIYSSLFYNTAVINRNFNKKKSINRNLSKWINFKYGINTFRTIMLLPWGLFTGFKNSHLPYSYRKETFEKVWKVEGEILERACEHKFRDPMDVSSRLLSYWQIAEGMFAPRSMKIGIQTFLSRDKSTNNQVFNAITTGKYKMICVNDEFEGDNFEEVKQLWINSFELRLPEKSSFEK